MTVFWQVIPKEKKLKKGMMGLPVRAMAGAVGIIRNLDKLKKDMTSVRRVIPKRRKIEKDMTGMPPAAVAPARNSRPRRLRPETADPAGSARASPRIASKNKTE